MKPVKILLLLLGLGAFAWAGMEGYKYVARELSRIADAKAKRRVVVMGFSSETGAKSKASAIVTERLTSEIASNPRMEVIERSRLDEVLKEQKLGARGVVDDATAKKIGNILGADAVVTGSVIDLDGKNVEVNARLVDTQNAHILKAVTKTIKKDWEEKKADWDLNFDMNIDLDAPMALLPDGFLEDETCRKLTDREKDLVRSCVELRARKTAWDLKSGVLKLDQLTKNPGSEIKDTDLKHFFYSKIKEWYYSKQLAPLSAGETGLLEANAQLIEKYPCR
ncbi:MAG TPA: hypothetical protein DCZ92_06380 [Elusimicrobia bacterium]|nr:MAG: hypothetical protein A2016_06395 [Elusimicrobia bacterium GWF2_62_30]HBA60433.1 hypothetical protein [Elusimicrobiota bacterium]